MQNVEQLRWQDFNLQDCEAGVVFMRSGLHCGNKYRCSLEFSLTNMYFSKYSRVCNTTLVDTQTNIWLYLKSTTYKFQAIYWCYKNEDDDIHKQKLLKDSYISQGLPQQG